MNGMRRIIVCVLLITVLLSPALAFDTWDPKKPNYVKCFEYEACYDDVAIRLKPSPDALKIGTIPKGTNKIRVSKQYSYWVYIAFEDSNGNWFAGWAASTAMCPVKEHCYD